MHVGNTQYRNAPGAIRWRIFIGAVMLKLMFALPLLIVLSGCGGAISVTPGLNVRVGPSEPTYYDGGPYWHRPYRGWW